MSSIRRDDRAPLFSDEERLPPPWAFVKQDNEMKGENEKLKGQIIEISAPCEVRNFVKEEGRTRVLAGSHVYRGRSRCFSKNESFRQKSNAVHVIPRDDELSPSFYISDARSLMISVATIGFSPGCSSTDFAIGATRIYAT